MTTVPPPEFLKPILALEIARPQMAHALGEPHWQSLAARVDQLLASIPPDTGADTLAAYGLTLYETCLGAGGEAGAAYARAYRAVERFTERSMGAPSARPPGLAPVSVRDIGQHSPARPLMPDEEETGRPQKPPWWRRAWETLGITRPPEPETVLSHE